MNSPNLRMADSVNVGSLPSGYDAYAGYANGKYANYGLLVGRFQASHRPTRLIKIDVLGTDPPADALDVERFDATPEQAPRWVEAASAYQSRPIVYVGLAQAQRVVELLGPRRYRLWTAHYGSPYGAHLCGPRCGFGLTRNADATQWRSLPGFDESTLAPDFFISRAAPQTPANAAGSVPQSKPIQEEPVFIVETIDTKTQYLIFDNGKAAELHSTTIGSGLTNAHVPYVTGSQADVDNIARGYSPA